MTDELRTIAPNQIDFAALDPMVAAQLAAVISTPTPTPSPVPADSVQAYTHPVACYLQLSITFYGQAQVKAYRRDGAVIPDQYVIATQPGIRAYVRVYPTCTRLNTLTVTRNPNIPAVIQPAFTADPLPEDLKRLLVSLCDQKEG